eukprot:5279288-Prorocentrum_lima.AAC.1
MAARQGLPHTAAVGSRGTSCSSCAWVVGTPPGLGVSLRPLDRMSCGPPGSRLSQVGSSGCSPAPGSPGGGGAGTLRCPAMLLKRRRRSAHAAGGR